MEIKDIAMKIKSEFDARYNKYVERVNNNRKKQVKPASGRRSPVVPSRPKTFDEASEAIRRDLGFDM